MPQHPSRTRRWVGRWAPRWRVRHICRVSRQRKLQRFREFSGRASRCHPSARWCRPDGVTPRQREARLRRHGWPPSGGRRRCCRTSPSKRERRRRLPSLSPSAQSCGDLGDHVAMRRPRRLRCRCWRVPRAAPRCSDRSKRAGEQSLTLDGRQLLLQPWRLRVELGSCLKKTKTNQRVGKTEKEFKCQYLQ